MLFSMLIQPVITAEGDTQAKARHLLKWATVFIIEYLGDKVAAYSETI